VRRVRLRRRALNSTEIQHETSGHVKVVLHDLEDGVDVEALLNVQVVDERLEGHVLLPAPPARPP